MRSLRVKLVRSHPNSAAKLIRDLDSHSKVGFNRVAAVDTGSFPAYVTPVSGVSRISCCK